MVARETCFAEEATVAQLFSSLYLRELDVLSRVGHLASAAAAEPRQSATLAAVRAAAEEKVRTRVPQLTVAGAIAADTGAHARPGAARRAPLRARRRARALPPGASAPAGSASLEPAPRQTSPRAARREIRPRHMDGVSPLMDTRSRADTG